MNSSLDIVLLIGLALIVGAILWLERARFVGLTVAPSGSRESRPAGGFYWRLLRQAGFNPGTAWPFFIGAKIVLALLLPLLLMQFTDAGPWAVWLVPVGFFIPDAFVAYVRRDRQRTIRRALSYFLDLLVSLLQAGLGVEEAFRRTAMDGLPPGHPLARESMQVLEELSLGRDRSLGFQALADRTGVPEFQGMANALGLALTQGATLETSLRAQAEVARARRREEGLRRMSLASAKVLLPLMLCGFPVFVVLVFVPLATRVLEGMRDLGGILRTP